MVKLKVINYNNAKFDQKCQVTLKSSKEAMNLGVILPYPFLLCGKYLHVTHQFYLDALYYRYNSALSLPVLPLFTLKKYFDGRFKQDSEIAGLTASA